MRRSEIIHALKSLGTAREEAVAVISDLSRLGAIEDVDHHRDRQVHGYVNCIQDAAGTDCTITVPTFTFSTGLLAVPYVHESAPSETGVLTEHIRTMPGAIRGVHPIFSCASIGSRRDELCLSVSRHSYGIGSTTHRLVEADALVLCVGLSPHTGSFAIHHGEVLPGVPYRYITQLFIPVSVDGVSMPGPFFHYAKYRDADLQWDTNRLMDRLLRAERIRFAPVGRSGIWAYRIRHMVQGTVDLLKRNAFGLLSRPPIRTPWTQHG